MPAARRPAPHRQRQGPRDVRPGRPAPDGRQRPDLDLRRRAPDADPGQGQGAHRPVGVLVRQDRPHRRQPLHLGDRGRARRGARPRDGRPQAARCCPSSASCAATSPARAGRTTRRPARSRASSCRRACASPSSCRRRSSRPSTKAEIGHDEAIDFDGAAELVGDRDLMARVRDVSIALYAFAAEHARERGVILADTKFEFGLDERRRARRRRRGAHARLLALLAGRRLRARPRPAELRQAVRARLGVRQRLGQDAAGAASCPTTSSPARASATSRPTSGSPASRSTPGWRAPARMRARVLIRPKAGILDPQGIAVERALPALGFAGVAERPRRPAGRARRRGPVRARRDVPASCWPTR